MSKELSEILSTDTGLAKSDLFKSFMDVNDKLTGGSFDGRRISIRGMKFRELVGGDEVAVSSANSMNIIVVDVAPVMRTFYEGEYDRDNVAAPTCWSNDTESPAPDVEEPQATRCVDCPNNIKGSGKGDSRACRYSQRMAVAIENKLDTVYQLSLPATSLFGEANGSHLPMQAYAKLLKAHEMPIIAVVTEMSFDEDSDVPKLFFKPARGVTEEELEAVAALRDTEETKRAITFTVSQTDGVEKKEKPPAKKTKPKAEKKTKPKAEKKVEKEEEPPEEEETVSEPTKVEKKAEKTVSDGKANLSALIEEWDD